ncbi:MAG: hypothetical protein LC768_04305 [Acidobacteria bacterium]|nr:hypothetical protein [Acidobacteriota bacterium]MCA1637548.1 hypothetical protein [Acidobacteriota bacterium]
MKNNRNFNALNLILLMILSLTFISATQAQSTDMDSPTALGSNVIEGEGDGKGETVYYSFTATKGDVKVTVDAKTDYYSTPLRVTLMDEDGNELLPIYVVAKGAGQREVKTKRFVRDTKVILKIATQDDKDVKLLTYKIKLDGAVKVEEPMMSLTETTPTTSEQSNPNSSTEQTPSADSSAAPTDDKETKKMTLKDKIKKKVKKEAKKVVDNNLDN